MPPGCNFSFFSDTSGDNLVSPPTILLEKNNIIFT